MKSRYAVKLFSSIFLIGAFVLFLAKPVTLKLTGFLTKSEVADANFLVIEGWLSYNDLKSAIDEFHSGEYDYIITTGLKSTTEYYNIHTDGYLIFYTGKYNTDPVKIIEVKAGSELDGENSSHFNLWVNDSIVAGFFADRRRKKYPATWDGSPVDSVMIQFTNDINGDFGDRNLFVKEIILNGEISIPFLDNTIYDISELDNRNRIINNMNSNSELTAKRLLSMGIDTSRVIAIPGKKVRINRTLTSALALRDWLRETDLPVKGINIVSSGTHSRRTWMTFKKILDPSLDVGVIALPDRRNTGSDGIAYLKTLRETIAYIYYLMILIPY